MHGWANDTIMGCHGTDKKAGIRLLDANLEVTWSGWGTIEKCEDKSTYKNSKSNKTENMWIRK